MKNYIPQEIIQEIKGRADILEVIGDDVLLRKAGRNYKGLCPFHTEKTPSFTVSPEKGIFYCFGCRTGGDVFQFTMKRNNLSFAEAVSFLADRYGLSSELHAQEEKGSRGQQCKKHQLLAVVEAAVEFFHRSLMSSSEGEKARKYLKKRGVLPEFAKRFRLGYAPISTDMLLSHFCSLGFSAEILKESSLLKEGRRGSYCWLGDRLVFPLFDHRGRAIGFGGRLLSSNREGKYPKYINSPEGPLYKKGEHFYGLHLAKESIRREGVALVVEGYLDLIALAQSGVENAVASLGTAVTLGHLQLLKRWATQVVLVFDGDTAGMKAVERMADSFIESGLMVRVLALPVGDDPDTFLRREGREAFLVRLRGAAPYLEHLIRRASERKDCSRLEGRLECIREILPLLAKVPNQVEKMFYLSLLADRTQSSETALLDELKKLSSTRTQFPSFPKKFVLSQNSLSKDLCKPDRVYYAERELVQLMLQEERFIESLRNSLPVESFRNAALREIARSLYEHYRDGLEGVSQKVIEALPSEEQRSLALQLSLERKEYEEVDKLVVDCLRVIENKKKTKPQIEELAMMYQQARTEEQYDDFGELQRQYLKMTRQEKR